MADNANITQLLDSMTLDEKVGQMLAFGFSGTYPHPDILRMIEQYHIAGLRVTPSRALIQAGLPAIMLAHSIFPALDPSGQIATISQPIIHDVLRGELGFESVVMTDSITMGGLANRYEIPDAVVLAVQAGVDLILLKDENALRGEANRGLLAAVHSSA